MSTPARRRPSRAVYRRRRLTLLLVLILIAALVWLFIAQPWNGASASGPAPSTTPTPASTPSPMPSSSSNGATADVTDAPPADGDAGVPECGKGDVNVEAVTDQSSYAADQNPQLSIRLTNTSGADCAMNVGTSGQSFTVTSGNDTWWRSTDCQTEPSDMVVTIPAGETVASAAPVTWDRTRSSGDTCQDPNRAKAPGGGASYHLAVAIGGIPSTTTAQFLLG